MSFEIEDFDIGKLNLERVYLKRDQHVTHGRISIVHIDRKRSVEDDKDFADGNSISANGTIESEILLLINGDRCSVKCGAEYQYGISRYGGVTGCWSENDDITFYGDTPITSVEFNIIQTCAKLASMSKYNNAKTIYKYSDDPIPRCFINHITQIFNLPDSGADEGGELKPYDEWDRSA